MRKTIIWDLDNTLYFETEEYKNKLNEATAAAAIKEFNVPLDFKEATEKVKESYATYRDGLEIFSREYGIPHKDLYVSYHNYKSELVKTIAPYEGLLENLKSLQCPQYVFSTSSKDICEKILKHIGLYDFFAGRFYSVEDFDVYKKNESPDVYARLCQTIGVNPQECIFVDDSYSNLDFAKQCGMTVSDYILSRAYNFKPKARLTKEEAVLLQNLDDCRSDLVKYTSALHGMSTKQRIAMFNQIPFMVGWLKELGNVAENVCQFLNAVKEKNKIPSNPKSEEE